MSKKLVKVTKHQSRVLSFLKKAKKFPGYSTLKKKFGNGAWSVVKSLKDKGLVSKNLK